MHDVDLCDVYAEDLVCDLRKRRLETLAVRMHADAKLETTVGRDARARLLVPRHHGNAPAGIDRRAVRRLLAINRHADADQPAVGFSARLAFAYSRQVDRCDGAPQGFWIIAAVEMFLRDVVEWHLFGPDEVFQAHLVRFDSGFPCDRVEHEFECEAHARARNAAIGKNRALVGCHRIGPAAIGWKVVGSGQDARDLRCFKTGRERIGRIGA